jgi:hypothetical protein
MRPVYRILFTRDCNGHFEGLSSALRPSKCTEALEVPPMGMQDEVHPVFRLGCHPLMQHLMLNWGSKG